MKAMNILSNKIRAVVHIHLCQHIRVHIVLHAINFFVCCKFFVAPLVCRRRSGIAPVIHPCQI
jgi:hypothetical protein